MHYPKLCRLGIDVHVARHSILLPRQQSLDHVTNHVMGITRVHVGVQITSIQWCMIQDTLGSMLHHPAVGVSQVTMLQCPAVGVGQVPMLHHPAVGVCQVPMLQCPAVGVGQVPMLHHAAVGVGQVTMLHHAAVGVGQVTTSSSRGMVQCPTTL